MQFLLSKLKSLYQFWMHQWENQKDDKEQGFRSFLIRIASILFLYVVLDRILMRITQMPLGTFYEPFIYFAFLKHIFTSWYILLLIPIIFSLIYFRKVLLCPWTEFPRGNYLRFFIVLTTAILAWFFSTYNYNLYFDQSHYFDRLLLLLFLLLVYWRPIFVLPFLTILLAVIWQFTVLEGFSWAIPFLPIRGLVLFYSFFIIYLVTRKFIVADFVFLAGCLVAAHYWASGFGKLSWQWVRYDQLCFLLPATYANGWLGFLKPETISSLTQFLSLFNLPLKIFTLTVEFGSIFFFLHRYSARFFLGGWIILHLGIFAVTGICFWIWIIMEAALLGLFLRESGFSKLPIFTKKHLIVSVLLIGGGTFWCNPVRLVWFDVPLNYTYRFEAVTESGQTLELPPKFFAPFDNQITLSRFGFLDSKKPLLGIVWGAGPAEIMKINSTDEAFALERSKGLIRFNATQTKEFEAFLKQHTQNWNKRLSKDIWLGFLSAPRFIWTYPTEAFDKPEPIKRINIIQITSFYDNVSYAEIRKEKVHEVLIY